MTGEILALASAFAFGLASVAVAKGARKGSAQGGVLLSAIATGLLSGCAWLLFELASEQPIDTLYWTAIGWFAASGLLATVGGRITMFQSIELAGVIRASTTRRLMPFFSLLLGWTVLKEQVSPVAGSGMFLIGISFVMLYWDHRSNIRVTSVDPSMRAMISRGLAIGVLSAGLYATSLVARKSGLTEVPNAFFGVFVGSVTAFAFYLGASLVSMRYRAMASKALSAPDPWQLLGHVDKLRTHNRAAAI